ncbi:non-specific lipid-transfer protein-like protein [Forsythia ovata]|uniref:Non-specific lipid-transfer protein-like protein n=1 Tax=Forsythia ovata TaxID=205694 RepID=A0ABD1PLF5_9LAMI
MASQFLFPTLTISLIVLSLTSTYAQITTPCTPSMISTFTPCMNFVTNSSLNGTSPPSDCCNSLKSLMNTGKDCFCLIATGSVPFNLPVNRTLAISLPRACNMPGVALQCKASGSPVPAPGPAAFGPTMSPKAAPSPTSEAPTSPEPLSPTLGPAADATPTPPSPTTGNTGNRAGVTPSAAQPSFTSGAPAPAPVPTAFGPTVSPKSAPPPTSKAPAASEPLSPTLSPEADATPTPPSPTTGSGAPTSTTGNRAGVTPSAAQPSFSVSPLLLLAMLGVIALKYY